MAAQPQRLLRQVRDLVPSPSASATEADLLDRFIRLQDGSAFAALVSRHGPMVLGVCRRVLGNAACAEDAAQATFLVLARKARTIRRPDGLSAWLHRTAWGLALKQRRGEVRRRQREVQGFRSARRDPPPDPLDELTVRELLEIFDEEVQQLPERYRLPLILCCLEGCTQEEAARRLSWTPGSVKGRLERGREQLQSRLLRRGLTLSAALAALEAVRGVASAAAPAPGLPAGVVTALLKAATLPAAQAGLAPEVVALAEDGLRNTAMFRTKVVLSLLLAVGLVTAGVAAVTHHRAAPPQAGKPPEQPGKEGTPVPEKARPRTDRHGDPLPEGAVARLGTVRWRGVGEAETVAFLPDGKVATGCRNGLCLFARDGRLTRHFRPTGTPVGHVAFAPDGKRVGWSGTVLARAGRPKGGVQVWELPEGRKVQEFPAEGVQWLGWSAEGDPQAVILTKGAVLFRDLASGKEQRFEAKDVPTYGLPACAYAPAGKVLAFPDQKGILHVWDVSRGKKLCAFKAEGDYVRGLALSPDGAWLASATQKDLTRTVQLWDVKAGKLARPLAGEQKNVDGVAFSPDGKTLATVGWHEVRFWEVPTGREGARAGGVASVGPTVAFSPDGKTLASVERHSGVVHLWDVATGKLKPAPAGHTNRPGQIAFAPDGRRIATGGSLDNTIFVWDPATGEPLNRMLLREWVRSCAYSADGRSLFYFSTGESVDCADPSTGRVLLSFKVEDPDRPETWESGLHMALSADGKTLVTFSSPFPRKGAAGRVGGLLLTGWDVSSRKQLFRRRRAEIAFWPVVSADARVLAAAQGGERKELGGIPGAAPILLEDVASGKRLLTLPEVPGQTIPVAFAPDGRLLVTNTWNGPVRSGKEDPGHRYRVWELASASEVLALPAADEPRAAFSPDGLLLALAAPRQEILLWDLRRGKEVRRLEGAGASVTSLAFSPDGRRLVSGLSDTSLLVWDVAEAVSGKGNALDAEGAARAWADLAGEARKAFAARGMLAGAPEQSVALLKEKLRPVQAADGRVVGGLLSDLDSEDFATREKARKGLEELGERASGAIHEALGRKPSLEVQRRLQGLLQRQRDPVTDPDVLRALRAIAVLEEVGTPEARKVLEALTGGLAEARQTREAKAALERLGRRVAPGR